MKNTKTDDETGIFSELSKWIIYASALCLIILIIIFIHINLQEEGATINSIGKEFSKDIIIQLISINILFLISSILLKRYEKFRDKIQRKIRNEEISDIVDKSIRKNLSIVKENSGIRFHDKFDDIDWNHILSDCHRLDVIVHYLDSWLRRYLDGFSSMINNAGEVLIIIPDASQKEAIDIIASRFSKFEKSSIFEKISTTKQKVEILSNQLGAMDDQITVHISSQMIWYSAFCIDEKKLFLSVFEHERGLQITSPVIEIDLDFFPNTGIWFRNEIDRLSRTSRENK